MKNAITLFKKFEDISNRVLELITNVIIVVLTLVVFSQIVGRYIFNVYLAWTEEASRYLMIWMVLLGAAIALKDNAHPRVTFVVDLLPKKAKAIANILANLAGMIFYFILIKFGIEFITLNFDTLSLSLKIPMGLVYIALPLGGAFLLINTISKVLKNLDDLGVISIEEGE